MDPKQKHTSAETEIEATFVPREVESINGYYKKVVLEPASSAPFETPMSDPTRVPDHDSNKPRHDLKDLALKVFNDRYALKNESGEQVEHTPEEMWSRVARAISSVEQGTKRQEWEQKFYWALEDFKFVPAGRILTGAGSEADVTFYNCYVLPYPDDSRGGIMDSVKTMVEIMARGGGVGVNLSSLRPRGSYVKGVNGKASGAVSFGALYSFATGLVIQGGSRRGALMLMINDDHPDVEEFVTVKRTMGQITNANLSVCISDKFMEAVKNDADWNLQWEGKLYKTIKAKYLWSLITESAWASGEPGCVFMERANKESNTWYFEDIICVNPCGEQPLPAWGVCNLGAINLSAFAIDGTIDWKNLAKTVRIAIRFLDNVIDATPYAFEENREAQMKVRRTGLGTMGLGDFLIKLGVRYGSDEGVALAEDVYRFVRDETYRASVEYAAEKGPFPMFDADKYLEGMYIKRLPEDIRQGIRTHGIRNGVLQTQAPTGTTSILAGASSGIEPVYDFSFKRTDRIGEHIVYHALYKEYAEKHPNEPVPDYFVNAKQLKPIEHVRMQAVIQKYTDASISKTVNAPEDHTHEDVKELYLKAYDLGCKGATYYRENSRDVSVLESLDSSKKKKTDGQGLTQQQSGTYVAPSVVTGVAVKEQPSDHPAVDQADREIEERSVSDKATEAEIPSMRHIEPQARPDVINGSTYKVKTAYGALYVTVNNDESGAPFEVFANIGKAGGFFAAKTEAICRLASLALRSGIAPEEVLKQLRGIRGPMPSFGPNGTKILSLADAIAQVLDRHISGNQATLDFAHAKPASESTSHPTNPSSRSIADHGIAPQCPECGGDLAMESGCYNCHSCGYSKCG